MGSQVPVSPVSFYIPSLPRHFLSFSIVSPRFFSSALFPFSVPVYLSHQVSLYSLFSVIVLSADFSLQKSQAKEGRKTKTTTSILFATNNHLLILQYLCRSFYPTLFISELVIQLHGIGHL
ncbi:hypothetical protein MRB53_026346 [Persea americana]|uniref:Uncharacterized protein n=1 Tax=Persea americana TaxID=3435 RepID=A0ACC2LI32_PERAE|nr:hypothetical protein MRB53_026346 [Persea americana]